MVYIFVQKLERRQENGKTEQRILAGICLRVNLGSLRQIAREVLTSGSVASVCDWGYLTRGSVVTLSFLSASPFISSDEWSFLLSGASWTVISADSINRFPLSLGTS